MISSLVVDVEPDSAGEPISVEEAKRHLRIFSNDLDSDIFGKLVAAREWCESYVSRTLRSEVTRTASMARWPRCCFQLEYPPIISVVAVNYYDTDDVDQTLAASNYHLVTSTESIGRLEWATDLTLPDLNDRPDAVRIQYKAGYGAGGVPEKARQAILTYLDVLWGDAKSKDLDRAEMTAKSLLSASDWGIYR